MSSKFNFFFSLLISSLAAFVDIKSIDPLDSDFTPNSNFNYSSNEDCLPYEDQWDEPLVTLFPSDKRRYEFISSFFFECSKSIPIDLIHDIVQLTSEFTMGQTADILINIVDSIEGDNIDRPTCLKIIEDEISKARTA
ncbi:MAG: hypothetical protein WCD44_02240 [Candidatus Babeliales bacterium]